MPSSTPQHKPPPLSVSVPTRTPLKSTPNPIDVPSKQALSLPDFLYKYSLPISCLPLLRKPACHMGYHS